jgi:hypothetical protein
MDNHNSDTGSVLSQRPDSFGRFGRFGGKYVPETLIHALTELEAAFHSLASDQDFQVLFTFSFSFITFQSQNDLRSILICLTELIYHQL